MRTSTLIAAAVLAASAAGAAQAYEADWKRGRVYFRQICTSCHLSQAKKSIAPNERTKADWAGYLQADKHMKGLTAKGLPAEGCQGRRRAGQLQLSTGPAHHTHRKGPFPCRRLHSGAAA